MILPHGAVARRRIHRNRRSEPCKERLATVSPGRAETEAQVSKRALTLEALQALGSLRVRSGGMIGSCRS